MSQLPDPALPPRRFPFLGLVVLGLLVLLCVVGLAIQAASWRSERTDQARVARPVPNSEEVAPNTTDRTVDDLPAFGEYVQVDELPEALTKVAPGYPDEARELGQEGTVIVEALVGKDGLVKDARVVKSIPELDDAAVSSVERWTFKPAQAKGKPVAVWVAVPVRFTLR